MSDPLHTPTMLFKNNLNIKTPGDRSPGGRSRYFPRKLLQDCENDPPSTMISPSKYAVVRNLAISKVKGPLEDHDTNSQDSGISDESKSSSEFRFAEPWGAAPRRMASIEMSPRRVRSPLTGTPDRGSSSPRVKRSRLPDISPKRSLIFSSDSATSLSSFSTESTDDGFLDLFQNDKLLDEDAQMSGSMLGNLLSAQILTSSTPPKSPQRPTFQRALSENLSPNKSEGFSLKRPLLLSSHSVDANTPLSKKHKPLSAQDLNVVPSHERGTLFQYGFKRSPAILNSSGLISPPHSITPEPISPSRACSSSPSASSEHSIKMGFQRKTTEELIGDFSRPFALPLLSAKDHDLKIISCETLAMLIKGEFADSVSSYKIIDCRYPYEFDGGHIKGAVNFYTRDQISKELHSCKKSKNERLLARKKSKELLTSASDSNSVGDETLAVSLSELECARIDGDCDSKPDSSNARLPSFNSGDEITFSSQLGSSNGSERHVLVFHCEYSAERGPNLYRCLRQEDRAVNSYPELVFPEVYLLGGGYKAFFSSHSDLCEPRSYKPMMDPNHSQDLRHFQSKSKSWNGKHHKKLSMRNLSRLGF